MAIKLKSILLATNLQKYNEVAFDVAISLATHYDAKLILLHVMEKLSERIEASLRGFLSSEQIKKIQDTEKEDARSTLIGKNISSHVIQEAIVDYCKTRGIDDTSFENANREVVVCEGDVVEEIIKYSEEHECGMIVMAAHEGLFAKSTVSKVIRRVLKQSTVPVLTVPHVFEKK
jgi:nucleotide-binding universal stress UspA family protein